MYYSDIQLKGLNKTKMDDTTTWSKSGTSWSHIFYCRIRMHTSHLTSLHC